MNPYWLDDIDVKTKNKLEVGFLRKPETQFFKDLIVTYLPPMPKDTPEEKEKQVQNTNHLH